METLKLRTGDKVTWKVGIDDCFIMVGVVLEELSDGTVDVICHTRNGLACTCSVIIDKSKLTLKIT
jgi:hypothetical protein